MIEIAVVDDDSAFVELVTDAAAERGWRVRAYDSGDRLLQGLRRAHPDVILLDLRLNRYSSGWDLFEQLRFDPILHRVPVIICSAARDELQAKAQWLQEHEIGVLEKPFELDALYSAVEAATWSAIPVRVAQEGA